jgi:hypothetical protein
MGGSAAAGAPTDPIDPGTCGCTTHMACVAQQVECKTAADCQAGWSCVADPTIGIDVPACPPGTMCDPPAPTPAPTMHCLPPYYGANSSGSLSSMPGVPGSTQTVGNVDNPPNTNGSAGTGNTNKGTGGTASNGAAGSGSSESHEVAACSMGHAPASTSALSLLAMLGALVGLGRRRARRG